MTTILSIFHLDMIQHGIILSKTSAIIQNNAFNNIQIMMFQPVNPAIEITKTSGQTYGNTHHVIIGGPNNEDKNAFTNCNKGIHLEQGNKTLIQNNTFMNTRNPVYFAFCSLEASTTVLSNKITNPTIGIYGYRNNFSPNTIKNNTIKWTGNATPGTGIKVESVLSLSEYYAIEFNNITKARIGIFTNSTTNSLIKENDIKFVSGYQNFISYGIRITGGEKMEVYGNSITGPGQAENYSRGISMSMCSKSNIECNSVTKCEHGLNFDGNMPSTVYRNSMKKNHYAITLTGGGYISDQGNFSCPQDNTWKQNTNDGWTFNSQGDLSEFHVRYSLPIPGNISVFQPYFSPSGTNNGTPLVAISDGNGPLVACQLSQQGPPFQTGFMKKIAKDQVNYNLYPQSESWEAKKGVYSILKSDTLQVYLTDTVLTNFADSMLLSPVEKIMLSTELYSTDSIVAAQMINNSLTVNTLPEQHLKTVNNIAFRNDQVATHYSSNDLQYLQFIASQCPYEYGPAVFVARALLSPVDTTFYTNTCEILSDSVTNRSMENGIQQDVDHVAKLILNPNPASEQIDVLLISENDVNWNWKILSIDGSAILNSGIVPANENQQINISGLENGVYLFTVFNGNNTLTKRLVVLK